MKQKTNDVNTFWSNFRDAVIRSGIDSSNADWYVKWAKQFAVSIKGRPLRQRTPKDINAFLANLNTHKDIRKWQVEQARDATPHCTLHLTMRDFAKRLNSKERGAPIKGGLEERPAKAFEA